MYLGTTSRSDKRLLPSAGKPVRQIFLPSTTISTNHKDMKFEIADQLFCDVKILVNC